MIKNKYTKILTLTFLFSFLIFSNFIYANINDPSTEPCWVKGTITEDGVDVAGVTIAAYHDSTFLRSAIIEEDGTYSLNSLGANDDDNISLKVFDATFDTFLFEGYCRTEDEGPWVVRDFEVSKVANGTSCNSNTICTSGYCNPSSDVCATRSTGGGSNGGSSGDSDDTPETTTETFNSTSTPSASEIRELLEDSGLTEAEIQAYVDAANAGQLEIKTTLKVVTTGSGDSATYKSTFTITITNKTGTNLRDIKIVEVIPKNIASSASEITTLAQFRVLVADPVLEFTIASLNAGASTTIIYSINDNVTQAEFLEMPGATAKGIVITTTPGTGTGTTPGTTPGTITPGTTTPDEEDVTDDTDVTPVKGKSATWLWVLLIIAVIALVVGVLLRSKRKVRKNRL